jgi:hypothetical protein
MAPDITWATGDSGAHGVYLENTLDAVVTENLVYDNRYRGLQLWPRNAGAEIHHNLFAENATHVNIGSSEACGGTCRPLGVGFISQDTDVHDNIFTDRVTDWRPSQNPSQVYGYFLEGSPAYGNAVHANCFAPGDAAATGNGFAEYDNTTAQATFVDADGRDYRLLADSPCRGLGPASIQPTDGEPEPSSIADATTTEGTGADTVLSFPISPPISGYAEAVIEAGTAGPEDYELLTTWLGGAENDAVRVRVVGDALDEGDETFTVRLVNNTAQELGDAVALGTIVDDDTSTPVAVYRPDAMVRAAGSPLRGDGVYNRSGARQSVRVPVRRRHSTVIRVPVTNDGNTADDWSIAQVAGNTRQFRYQWQVGRRVVTSDVAGGNLAFPDVPPGARRTLKLVVTPKKRARVGTVGTWYLHAVHNPLADDIRDVVRIRVVARR